MAFQNGNKGDRSLSFNPSDWYDWENIKVKRSPLLRDPLVSDDHTKGYNMFSMIINYSSTPNKIWVCVNPEENNAVWIDVSSIYISKKIFTFEIADWILSSGIYYIEFTHDLENINTNIEIRKGVNTVLLDTVAVSDNALRIQVPSIPDCRFDGSIIIVG